MKRRRSAALLPLVLGAACLGFGWKIYGDRVQATADAAAPATVESAPSTPAAQADPDPALSLPPAEAFATIVERPLFSATRRPWQPPPVVEAAPEPEPPPEPAPPPEPVAIPAPEPPPAIEFTLVGIVIAGAERQALVLRQGDGKVVQVPEGGEVAGWFAVLIDPDRAVFRQRGFEQELLLKYDTPVPPEMIPQPPAPAAAPPGAPEASGN